MPGLHPLDHHRGLEHVAAVLREHLADTRRTHLMTGTTDPLQPRRHRVRRLDLDHEIDRAHVDAQLQRAGGHQRAELPGLQFVLDAQPLLAAQRTVVCLDQLVALVRARAVEGVATIGALEVQLVEAAGETFGQPTGVDEDERAAVLEDQLQQPRVHRGPDRVPRALVAEVGAAGRLGHVLDRDDDLDVEGLGGPDVDDGDVARCTVLVTAEKAGDLVERTLGGGEGDALWP